MLKRLKYRLQGWVWPAKTAPERLRRGMAPQDDAFKHLSFTFAVIALSARVACIDGRLTKEKYVAFREAFPLHGHVCGKIRSLFMLACDNQTPLEQYTQQIKYAFPRRQELFASLVDRLFSIAAADGVVSRDAKKLLEKIAHMLQLKGSAEYTEISERHDHLSNAHEVLGVSKACAAPRTLKETLFRRLMQRYHPDRFSGDDLSPEVQLLLKLKTSEINKAYRALTRRAA